MDIGKERRDYMKEKAVIEKLAELLEQRNFITFEESLKLKELLKKEKI